MMRVFWTHFLIMRLVDLVAFCRNGGDEEELRRMFSLDAESEAILMFMLPPPAVDAELLFVEIEKTGGSTRYVRDGVSFYHLFELYYCIEAIMESPDNSAREIAEMLLHYAIYDA